LGKKLRGASGDLVPGPPRAGRRTASGGLRLYPNIINGIVGFTRGKGKKIGEGEKGKGDGGPGCARAMIHRQDAGATGRVATSGGPVEGERAAGKRGETCRKLRLLILCSDIIVII